MKKQHLAVVAAGYCTIVCAILAGVWFYRRVPADVPEEYLSREALLAIASDPGKSPDARGKAVFRILADYVPSKASAATIRQVFGDCNWIAETRISCLDFQTGQGHPLWALVHGTLFRLDLFTPDDISNWIVYVRFSGSGHSLEEVKRFFSPKAAPDPEIQLVEFALWNLRTRKQEVFDATGRHPPKDD